MDAVGEHAKRVESRIVVTGRVQGVGFRWFAREAARALGVAGWARNMPDGTVVLEVSAQRDTLDRFVGRLRQGPPAATVVAVHLSLRQDPSPLPEPFTVIR